MSDIETIVAKFRQFLEATGDRDGKSGVDHLGNQVKSVFWNRFTRTGNGTPGKKSLNELSANLPGLRLDDWLTP